MNHDDLIYAPISTKVVGFVLYNKTSSGSRYYAITINDRNVGEITFYSATLGASCRLYCDRRGKQWAWPHGADSSDALKEFFDLHHIDYKTVKLP